MYEILAQRALKLLLDGPCSTKEFIAKVAGSDRDNFKKTELTTLGLRLRRGELVRVLDGKYYITDIGRAHLGTDNTAKPDTVNRMVGDYTCPELGKTCHRPGAYDFLEVPSVFGPERRPYKFRSGVN